MSEINLSRGVMKRLLPWALLPMVLAASVSAQELGDRIIINGYTNFEFEKQLILNPEPKSASCIEGARACPPEDCGGPHGYAEFLRVLLTPEADELEQQREMKVWSGGRFHPGKFDLAKTDKAVRRAHRRQQAR